MSTIGRLAVAALLSAAAAGPSPRIGTMRTEIFVLARGNGGTASRDLTSLHALSAALESNEPAVPISYKSGGLPGAIKAALARADPDRQPVLALVRNGANPGEDVRRALNAAVANGAMALLIEAREAAGGRPTISALHVPASVLSGDAVPVTVELAREPADAVVIEVTVDGEPATQIRSRLVGRADVVLQRPGIHEIAANLSGEPEAAAHRALVNVAAGPDVVVLTRDGARSAASDVLAKSGVSVRTLPPTAFDPFVPFDLLVLDDLAAGDLSESTWHAIEHAVRASGSGLLTLGGPRSFAAGSYRGTILETMLPVTIESPRPDDSTAILFLVDKSGSMSEPQAGAGAFDYARQAVIDSATTLRHGDSAGLMWFDKEPLFGLKIASRANTAQAFEEAWTAVPSGGTVLVPALRAAIAQMEQVPAGRRVLVVITDGGIDANEPIADLIPSVRAAKIDVIAVLVGDADAGGLRALTEVNEGATLTAREIPVLPDRVTGELQRRRGAVVDGPVAAVPRRPLPFMIGTPAWPPVGALWTTRARDDATVYLATPDGLPILATRRVGAGMSAVLPSGLGAWSRAWLAWPEIVPLTAALVRTLALASGDATATLRATTDGLLFETDRQGFDGWDVFATEDATIEDPLGYISRVPLVPIAPGRARAEIPAAAAGRYAVSARLDERTVRAAAIFDPSGGGPVSQEVGWDSLLAEGLVTRWPLKGGEGAMPPRKRRPVPLAGAFATAALLLYLGVLALERRTGRPRRNAPSS